MKKFEKKFDKKPDKKIIALAAIALIVFIIIGVNYSASNKVNGQMEAVVVTNIAEVSGKVIEMRVELGQVVAEGEVIAVLDSKNQQYEVNRLEMSLEQAMLALGEAQGGSGSSSGNALLSAQAAYNSAASSAQLARSEYQKALTLYQSGAISKSELDKAKLAADTAGDKVTQASAQLSNASDNFSAENSELAVGKIQSQLEQARETLEKYNIKAAADGTIISRSYTVGAMVAAGYDVADIASATERYIVAYVPVEKVSTLEYDQKLTIKFDGTKYEGIVKYLDVSSSYTPKEMQSAADKNRKTVKVKLLMPEDCPMKPGQTAKVYL